MYHYPPSVRNLISALSRLPGIGEKTAERLAVHIIQMSDVEAGRLAESITAVKRRVRSCRLCHALSDEEICGICADAARDATRLCVVEQPADMASIEKSASFNGRYHILNGALSPMDGIGPDALEIEDLVRRVAAGGIEEVILATGTGLEGEATASYIAEQLKPFSVRLTRIAAGVPIGGDLKYVDQVTLKRALETRRDL